MAAIDDPSWRRLAACVVMLAACSISASVCAAPLDDVRAANIALGLGDRATAERLLGQALSSGTLSAVDEERAYLKRAEAYEQDGDAVSALADVAHAANLDPKDTEPTALRSLIEHPVELGVPLVALQIQASDWSALPDGPDFAAVYPDRAEHQGVPGRVILRCVVSATGTLVHCTVPAEAPEGQDFGSAGLQLSRRFRIRPVTKRGVPTEGRTIVIPIQFMPPQPGISPFEALSDASKAYKAKGYAAQDCSEAMKGFRRAAGLGSVPAAHDVGLLYQEGCGGPSDMAQALAWYEAGAVRAEPAAWDAIGRVYAEGMGVPRDEAAARSWMMKAAAAGVLDAEVWLTAHPPSAVQAEILAKPLATALYIKTPDWAHQPSATDLAPYRPVAAHGAPGGAVVDCVAEPDGRLTQCKSLQVTPMHMDYEYAGSLVARRLFRLEPVLADGRSVAGLHVLVTVIWR